jgi:hypothetical protein
MFCFLIWKEIFIGRVWVFLCCKKCKTNKNFQSFSDDKFYSTFTRMVKEMRDIKLDLNFLLNRNLFKKLSWAELIYHRDFLLSEKLIWDSTVSPRFSIGWKNRHLIIDWLKLWFVNSLFQSWLNIFLCLLLFLIILFIKRIKTEM